MPLRDHFRPPIWKKSSWEGFHGGWPMMMVLELNKVLPEGYSAEPRVRLGDFYEIDLCAFETPETERPRFQTVENSGSVATAAWAPPEPTLTIETDLAEEYAYEVLIFDQERGKVLVAAIEIVSPANKDRPRSRKAFVTKCAALIQDDVCVSLVDLVTVRTFNLYAELLNFLGQSDPSMSGRSPNLYAATCRVNRDRQPPVLESWAYRLELGKTLPSLPIWLAPDLAVSLDLEASYENTCRPLRLA